MKRECIEKIIEALEHVRERPMMFAGDETTEAVASFLNGFDIACHVLGMQRAPGARYKAETERGWKSGAEGWALSQLRARGMTEKEMVAEMLAIHIATWRITAEVMDGKAPVLSPPYSHESTSERPTPHEEIFATTAD